MRYSVGFLNHTRVSDHRFQGPVHPIFLLYIMKNAVRLHSFKNIQSFLSSPVSSLKLNMYYILAFPSLGSEIQVSWDRTPYPLIVSEKLATVSLAPRLKFCGIQRNIDFIQFSTSTCLSLKDGEKLVTINSRYSVSSEDDSLFHHYQNTSIFDTNCQL